VLKYDLFHVINQPIVKWCNSWMRSCLLQYSHNYVRRVDRSTQMLNSYLCTCDINRLRLKLNPKLESATAGNDIVPAIGSPIEVSPISTIAPIGPAIENIIVQHTESLLNTQFIGTIVERVIAGIR
jgi:hypothetical protein